MGTDLVTRNNGHRFTSYETIELYGWVDFYILKLVVKHFGRVKCFSNYID